ncbi:TPA_asm: hypothetical protein vir520_00066 [Caudoviricetes sp. vir520]|nr:TPA_asm: hypothetical protein vir520_00066 [Caudoviricetes sp. vir520]
MFFPNVTASPGDLVFFYLPTIADKVVGDTITINGIVYYVSANFNLQFGDQDPVIKIALLTIYAPPDIPNISSYRWGDLWSGKIHIFFGNQDVMFIHHYEIWRSFDQTNYHFLKQIPEGPFTDEPPPLENIWYKIRAVDTFYRKSGFTAPMYFQAQWQRYYDNPVLELTPAAWDSWGVTCPNLHYSRGDGNIHMYYGGMTGVIAGYQIGHATLSIADWKNGLWTNWVKDPANPIMSPAGAGFMMNGVFEPYVRWYNSQFICLHTGYDNHNAGGMDAAGIGAFTSPSLYGPWTAVSNVVPRIDLGAGGEWDDFDLFAASLYYEGNTYHAWYSASNGPLQNWRIGHATSVGDPIGVYTKDVSNPVLSYTGAGWESDQVCFLRYIPWGTFLIGYYQGFDVLRRGQWGTLWSSDPDGAIYRTPNNPDMKFTAGNEATLRIGGSLFKDPIYNRWTWWYGNADFPVTLAEISVMVLVPVSPL